MRPTSSINLSGLLVGADNQSKRSDGEEWWTDESHETVSSWTVNVEKIYDVQLFTSQCFCVK